MQNFFLLFEDVNCTLIESILLVCYQRFLMYIISRYLMLLTTLSRFFLTHTHLNLYICIPVFMWYVNGFIYTMICNFVFIYWRVCKFHDLFIKVYYSDKYSIHVFIYFLIYFFMIWKRINSYSSIQLLDVYNVWIVPCILPWQLYLSPYISV